jgi:hypothetical protein
LKDLDAPVVKSPVKILTVLALSAAIAGCSVTPDADQSVPDASRDRRSDVEAVSRLEGGEETLFGELALGGSSKKKEEAGGGGAAVNLYLWRATLETLALGPLESADPFGGVIITDWFTLDEEPGNQYRVTAYILGRSLRTDNLKIAMYVRNKKQGNITTQRATPAAETRLENLILTKARTIRATQFK